MSLHRRLPPIVCIVVVVTALLTFAQAEPEKSKPAESTAAAVKDAVEAAQPEAAEEFQLAAVEREVIRLTNEFRAKRGLPELEASETLVKTARRHSAWMTTHRSMVHGKLRWPVCAENIAMGQRSAAQVVAAWINSPGHRANILRGSHRKIGIGAYKTPSGTIYWCQHFSR